MTYDVRFMMCVVICVMYERNVAAYVAHWAIDPSEEILIILLINIRIHYINYSKSR